ncbi:Sensory transduction histidine kinase [Ceraceosorus bombacis]|uniref:histidine kinase n=1 Tax=Ceraceosorus bombacis TaxID=401625 RepID=A0A0P1BAK0_9BASI|nr:Sensory transduction histidine kinase [Ceraceosorus bombacis]
MTDDTLADFGLASRPSEGDTPTDSNLSASELGGSSDNSSPTDEASVKAPVSPTRQFELENTASDSSLSSSRDQKLLFCSLAPKKPDFEDEEEWERFFAAYRTGRWTDWADAAATSGAGSAALLPLEPAQKLVYDQEGHLLEPREFYRRHGYLAPPSVPSVQRLAREYAGIRHSCSLPRRNVKRHTADRYARHAKAVFRAAAATVTVACAQTTEPKILFLGQAGWLADNVIRASQTLCAHAMLSPRAVVCIPDLDADWRTVGLQPRDSRGQRVRFYASAPLVVSTPDSDGPASQQVCGGLSKVELGRLTILGTEPRSDFSEDDARVLQDIAEMISEALEHEAKHSQVQRMKKNQIAIAQLARDTADDVDDMDRDDMQEDQEMLGHQHFTSSSAANRSGHVRPRRLQKVANLVRSTFEASAVYAIDVTSARITSHRRSSTYGEGPISGRPVTDSPHSASSAAYPQTPWLHSSGSSGPQTTPLTPSSTDVHAHSLFPDVSSSSVAADMNTVAGAPPLSALSPTSSTGFSTRRPTLRHQVTNSSSASGSGLGSGFVPSSSSSTSHRQSWSAATAHRISHASQGSDASSGEYSGHTSVDASSQTSELDFTCSLVPDSSFQFLALAGRPERVHELDIRSHEAQSALCQYMASRRERSDLDIDMHFGAVPLHDDILHPNQDALYSDALEPLWASSGRQPATALTMLVFDHDRQPTYLILACFDEVRLFDAGDWGFGRACIAVLYACVLRDSARMTSRQELQFVRRVQHELRTPLHAILGITDFLRGMAASAGDEGTVQDLDHEMLSDLLQAIRLAGTNLSSILDDVLDLGEVSGLKSNTSTKNRSAQSNEPSGKPALDTRTEEVCLRSEVEEAVENELQMVEMNNRQDTQMDETVPAKGPPIVIIDIAESIGRRWRIDRARTLKVIRKIVNNAVRFNRAEGGLVELTITPRRDAPKRRQQNETTRKVDVLVDSARPASSDGEVMVDFAIEDTGVGMTNAFCAHDLVRPFSKRDGFSQGIGLGFTIASALTSQIGGYIDVKSKLGVGTIVTATLPLLPVPTTEVASSAASPYCVSKVWFGGFSGHALERAQSFIMRRLQTGGIQLVSHMEEAGLWILSEGASQAFCALHAGTARQQKPRVAVLVSSPTAPIKLTEHLETLQVPVAVMRAPLCGTLLARLEMFLRDKSPTIIRAPQPHLPLQEHPELAQGTNAVAHSVEGAAVTSSPLSSATEVAVQSSAPESVAESGASSTSTSQEGAEQAVSSKAISSSPGSVTFLEPAPVDAFARPSSNPSVNSSTSPAYRVLLVEDNSVNMKLLTTIVKRLGLPYEEAHDGVEAAERFVAFEPQLVLLDMSMPRMDGFEAALHMRAHDLQPRPRIVAITALSSPADRARGLECGCDEWRTKPLSIRALKIDLERWCADHQSLIASEKAVDKHQPGQQSVAA